MLQEVYEPLWHDLYERTKQKGIGIRSIWIADMWNSGQSGIANETILGDDRECAMLPNNISNETSNRVKRAGLITQGTS